MGNTPSRRNRKLEKSIQGRKLKKVKKWLKRGGDPNEYSKKSNYSFLSMAITLREEALVRILLQKGANPNQKSWSASGKGTLQHKQSNDDEFPIHIAAAHGSIKIMEALLSSKIDINIGQDHKLGTALHQVARFGHSKMAELLLANGADIIGIDSKLNIPLHIAATYGQTKVAETLLRYGSPINTSNMKSWTPLHYASSEGAVSMTRLLLEHGADAKLEDGTGKTPIDVVKSEDVLRVFLEHAIDNPDHSICDEFPEYPDTVNDSVVVPPKPARTFAFTSVTARGRTQSQGVETIANSIPSFKLKSSNSYSDFGKWVRHQKSLKTSQIQHREEDDVPTIFRRTKSTPIKKQQKRDVRSPKDVKTEKYESRRSRSFHGRKKAEMIKHHRTYSVRYRKPTNTSLQNVVVKARESNDEVAQSHRRTKSMSAMSKRRRMAKKAEVMKQNSEKSSDNTPVAQTATSISEYEKSCHRIEKEAKNMPFETQNGMHNDKSLSSSLSRSLHNLAIISEEADEPACDANANYTAKRSVHRTKSDGINYYPKKGKSLWIEGQRRPAQCQLNGR